MTAVAMEHHSSERRRRIVEDALKTALSFGAAAAAAGSLVACQMPMEDMLGLALGGDLTVAGGPAFALPSLDHFGGEDQQAAQLRDQPSGAASALFASTSPASSSSSFWVAACTPMLAGAAVGLALERQRRRRRCGVKGSSDHLAASESALGARPRQPQRQLGRLSEFSPWKLSRRALEESLAEKENADEIHRRFVTNRTLTFLGMMGGYATYYFTRLSYSFVGPALRQDLGLSIIQLGAVSSIFPLAYMNSKFIAGVLSDLLGSPVLLFALGMILTGLCNIGFTMGNSIPWFTFWWIANGLFQGCGGTPCGKMLVNWYPTVTRGRWWSTWNSSTTIGGFLIPFIAGTVSAKYGWQWGMRAPGIIAIAVGLLAFFVMSDSPEKLGLPSAEEHHAMQQGLTTSESSSAGPPPGRVEQSHPSKASSSSTSASAEPEMSKMQLLLGNKFLWCMAAMHFFVYLMRTGTMNWVVFYLMDQFSLTPLEAASRVSGFEFGGLFGCIASGLLSDYLISKNPQAGAAGMRARVMFLFSLLSPLAILGLWKLPPVGWLQWTVLALFGFSIYGPQTLITMTGVETVPKKIAASAGGLLAYPAQFGSMLAGLPFAMVVRKFGWSGYFPCLILLSGLSALSVLPGWNALAWSQKEALVRKKQEQQQGQP